MTDNTMQWGDPLTDGQLEALASVAPYLIGGDAEEWGHGATFLYVLAEATTVGSITFEPGQYIRHVAGNTVTGWEVTGDADEYVEVIEEAWQAMQLSPPERCESCHAEPGEPCRTPTCQGNWH